MKKTPAATRWARENAGRCRASRKKYQHANREKVYRQHRNQQLKSLYGITLADYERMMGEQECRCRICFRPAAECPHKKLHVDHCHETKIVRGLLCAQCNTLLGLAGHSARVLTNAIAYLDRRMVA